MKEKKKIIVVGAGGHSHSVCDILLQDPTNEIIGLIDKDPDAGFWGMKVLGTDEQLPMLFRQGLAQYLFIGLGSNRLRKKLAEQAKEIGFQLVNAISPQSYVSPHAIVGDGVAIMPGAIIGPNAVIGDGTIINTNASVDHDDIIGAYCHVAPGVTISGKTHIGDLSFIGVGATVIDFITIGSNVIVGAGAVVIKDLPSNCKAVGVPTRIIGNQTVEN